MTNRPAIIAPATGLAETFKDVIRRHGHRLVMPFGDESPLVWEDRALTAIDELDAGGLLVPLTEPLVSLAWGAVAQELVEYPGRPALVGELARHLADPQRINQGLKGTCAAACIETGLAVHDPPRLAALVAGLVTPSGTVELPDSEPLQRDDAWLSRDRSERSRSPISQLFQVAVMELAYPELDYRNLADGQFQEGPDGASYDTGTGMDTAEFDAVLEALTGQVWDVMSDRQSKRLERLEALFGLRMEDLPRLPDDALAIIRRTTEAGDSLFATLEPPGGVIDPHVAPTERLVTYAMTHKVRITGLDPTQRRVIFDDPMDPTHPWYVALDTRLLDTEGTTSVAIDDLLGALRDLSYQPRYWKQEMEARGVG